MKSKIYVKLATQLALVVRNPPSNARDRRDVGSILGSGKCPGVGPAVESSDARPRSSCLIQWSVGSHWKLWSGRVAFLTAVPG